MVVSKEEGKREKKKEYVFFSPGKRSLRSQAMYRALVQSVVTQQRAKSQQEAEAEGQAMRTIPGIQRKGEDYHLVRPQVPSPHTRHTRFWIYS